MSTITAVLEPHADGSLHLPLPAELRHRRVRIEAKLEAADEMESISALATPAMLGQRKEALAALRALGGLKDVIPDPAAWQREQREDRPLQVGQLRRLWESIELEIVRVLEAMNRLKESPDYELYRLTTQAPAFFDETATTHVERLEKERSALEGEAAEPAKEIEELTGQPAPGSAART